MAGTVVECLMLVRILLLRLQGVYTFITLYWAVNLIFDIAAWSFGWKSQVTSRIAMYEITLLGAIFPFAVWDVFEESVAVLGKIRRVFLPKLFSGLFFAVLLGFMLAAGVDEQADPGANSTEIFGLFFWLGSALASLVFVWSVVRSTKSDRNNLSANTRVWSVFFLITLLRCVVDFMANLSGPLIGQTALGFVQLTLLLVDICLALWCMLKLRSSQPDANGAPQGAGL